MNCFRVKRLTVCNRTPHYCSQTCLEIYSATKSEAKWTDVALAYRDMLYKLAVLFFVFQVLSLLGSGFPNTVCTSSSILAEILGEIVASFTAVLILK